MDHPKIAAALLAGTGVYEMAEYIIRRLIEDPLIDHIYVYFPPGKHKYFLGFKPFSNPRITMIEEWYGPDNHDATGRNREVLRRHVKNYNYGSIPDWIWFGDEDAFPAPDYFQILSQIHYDEPVLLTGKTVNVDGRRWYDICSFQTDSHPFCVPYDDWDNPRWAKDLYVSGNQHVINRPGFLLDIPYPDIPGEDPYFCWSFRQAGGRLRFDPRLRMDLLKWHPHANHGYPPCLPPPIPTGEFGYP